MFKIPDRVADLFGDHGIRVEFERALIAAGQLESYEQKYFEVCSFSEAARITYRQLVDFDRASLTDEQQELVAGAKALAHRLITAGYAIDAAAKADQGVIDDWPQLLAFVQQKCAARVGLPGHEGWERCFTYIIGRCEEVIQPSRLPDDRGAASAVLRHFASFFPRDAGFERAWWIEVPDAD
ncbi:hypothetical protein [Streptomyces sp. NPDC057580]|uniref:hypothetical protein n=1 Tax=Streptomyces sp. NPDC057580 TaxID=3346173 RepID=UPI00368BA88B